MGMSITGPEQLQMAIDKAISGDRGILFSIGKYIAYNYYMCFHIKEGSQDDLENEKIYKAFEKEYPDLHAQVEGVVTYYYNRITDDDD
jgi:hypothetical protein